MAEPRTKRIRSELHDTLDESQGIRQKHFYSIGHPRNASYDVRVALFIAFERQIELLEVPVILGCSFGSVTEAWPALYMNSNLSDFGGMCRLPEVFCG